MIEHKQKNELCSGNSVSAKSLSFGKAKVQAKGQSRAHAPLDEPTDSDNGHEGARHMEHR